MLAEVIAAGAGCTGTDAGTCSPGRAVYTLEQLYLQSMISQKTHAAIGIACADSLAFTQANSECQRLLLLAGKEAGPYDNYNVHDTCGPWSALQAEHGALRHRHSVIRLCVPLCMIPAVGLTLTHQPLSNINRSCCISRPHHAVPRPWSGTFGRFLCEEVGQNWPTCQRFLTDEKLSAENEQNGSGHKHSALGSTMPSQNKRSQLRSLQEHAPETCE
jgi:hypothetical protein